MEVGFGLHNYITFIKMLTRNLHEVPLHCESWKTKNRTICSSTCKKTVLIFLPHITQYSKSFTGKEADGRGKYLLITMVHQDFQEPEMLIQGYSKVTLLI